MKCDMDEREHVGASGSDADVSSESSDTPCSQRPGSSREAIDKVFVQWVMPSSPADKAGLMQGDELINVNNSTVYGKTEADIQNILQHSDSIELDIVEGAVKPRSKGRYRGARWNPYDGYSSNHEEASDRGSSLSLTSCSSDNGTSPSSLSPPAQDRCFVVMYGEMGQAELSDRRNGPMRSFQRPLSYSDEEPQMENKSVGLSAGRIQANFIDMPEPGGPKPNSTNVLSDEEVPVFEATNGDTSNGIGLTNSTTSSVLVDSLDTKATCMTVTTATYSTLASPQLPREEIRREQDEGSATPVEHGALEEQTTSKETEDPALKMRNATGSSVRPRSPSPVQRRVSYLMATEGNPSFAAGNWVVKAVVNGEESAGSLVPLKEESTENLSSNTGQDQGESDTDEKEQGVEYSAAKLTVGQPVVLNYRRERARNILQTDDQSKVEDRRHSLKRKCSADIFEVEKEGYLCRKLFAPHGRRSWKQVYVVLKAHVLYFYKDKPDQMLNAGQDEKPISIKSCIVDIAYDYRKRDNVFRLTTYNGSQYLLQATDKTSMMSWIAAIQKNNNPDEDKSGVTSENLIVRRKKNMDNEISSGQTTNKQIPPSSLKISGLKKSLSFKSSSGGGQSSFKSQKKAVDGEPGKATWHNKMVNKMKKMGSTSSPMPAYQMPGYSVGLPLDRCPTSKINPSLPLLVEHCCQVVENKGLESVGIYRVPGNSANVAALEEELNSKTPDTMDFEEPRWNDANNMGSLLKKFLRKLPEGLVTSELYGGFIEANRKEGEDRMLSLKDLIQQLPCVYGETLSFLIRHLKKVSEHSDTNKMEIRNLAIVFGPTIVRTGEDNMMTMVSDMTDRFRIVESFITNFDWFFDNESVSNGSMSPSSPPVEEFSKHLMSTNMVNSMEQAAVSYDSNESNWKFKSPSIKLPNFKNLIKHGSDGSKKSDISSGHGSNSDPFDNGKVSPVSLAPYPPRPSGGSQPNSPTTGRRKLTKRHHSTSNISSTSPVHDDYDRSKSEGEDDEVLFPRPNHATKAYSYARPPPPSYRELRDKGSFRGLPSHVNTTLIAQPTATTKEPPVFAESGDAPDFNSLSEETKRRLLRFTLQKKVNEKKKQQNTETGSVDSLPTVQNAVSLNFNQGVVNLSFVQSDVFDDSRNISPPLTPESHSEENNDSVVFEPQLKASEIKKRFEHLSEDTVQIPIVPVENKQANASEPAPQLRRREGPAPSSSSRNFKIYSNSEVNFSQYEPDQLKEWVHNMGQDGNEEKERARGRRIARVDEGSRGPRSASVSRTTFIQDEPDVVLKRRSASCQDINIEDSDILEQMAALSKSSESSDSSDDDDDDEIAAPHDIISMSFDEKLRGLLQKSKLENRSRTEMQPHRKLSQANSPPCYTRSKSSVDKMRAMDPSSKIQSGAVSSMKTLFESGAAHSHPAKSRSSSISSTTSSGSVLSAETQRNKATKSTSEAEVKKRVWEVQSESAGGESRRKWKEPIWLAREREIKNLRSGSESSLAGISDDNNNVRKSDDKSDYIAKQYSRSSTLPSKPGQPGKRVPDITDSPPAISQPENARPIAAVEKTFGYAKKGTLAGPVKTVTTVRNVTSPKTSVRQSPPVSTNKNCPEASKNTTHKPLHNTKSLPAETGSAGAPQKSANRARRRIASENHRRGYANSRQPNGRTFTAPLLGSVVTTTAYELEGFPIKPENANRASKPQRSIRRSATAHTRPSQQQQQMLGIQKNSLHAAPKQQAKGILAVPLLDDESKRLSTDRSILEQNALHIKELLDEMNTEHSLKMERQKSDTISMNAQRSARKKALRRRHSLGPETESGLVVTCLSPSNGLNEHGRTDNLTSLTPTANDLQRNTSTVKWVGVSS